jgi:signal recognition particle receptor subunit beta
LKTVAFKTAILIFKEIGGSDKLRPYWNRYFQGACALVYVIDCSSPQEKISASIEAFAEVMASPAWLNAPILVVANKQDVAGSISAETVSNISRFIAYLSWSILS